MVCIDTIHPDKAIQVMNKMLDIFGDRISDNILFTDIEYNTNRINVQKIDKIVNLMHYSNFVVADLPNYINTDFCMIVQHDGYIINPKLWTEDFLNYDYIGAPWKEDTVKLYGLTQKVGNGGFSIRSKRLMDAMKRPYWYDPFWGTEDIYTALFMQYLYEGEFKPAPLELAAKFSFEHQIPERNYSIENCFGMHDFKAHPELKEKYKI